MRGRVENFGDYNTARILVQENGGDLNAVIEKFMDAGAREALPKHLGIGLAIGAPIFIGGTIAVGKISEYVKKRKELKRKELEEELKAVLDQGDDQQLMEK